MEDILDIKRGQFLVKLGSTAIATKGNSLIKNVVCLCSAMSTEDYIRVMTLDNSVQSVRSAIENNILKKYVIGFYGVQKEDVDFENSDAGAVDKIVKAIFLFTQRFIEKPKEIIEEMESTVSNIETIAAIVSSRLNIDYTKVIAMPLPEVYRMLAVLNIASKVQE